MWAFLIAYTLLYTPLTEQEAQSVVDYLQVQSEVVVYTDCEAATLAKVIVLDTAFATYNEAHNSYELVVAGTLIKTFKVKENTFTKVATTQETWQGNVDLAHLFVLVRSNDDFYKVRSNLWDARCLGTILPIETFPCVEVFEYPRQER